jgi:flagellar motor component MotA
VVSGGSPDQFVNLPGVLIVFGGTLAATFIKLPPHCVRAVRGSHAAHRQSP